MERCELRLDISSDHISSDAPSTLEIYRLNSTMPIELEVASSQTRPARVSKVATLDLAGSDVHWHREFHCQMNEYMTFELACKLALSGNGCRVQWWQSASHHPSGTSVTRSDRGGSQTQMLRSGIHSTARYHMIRAPRRKRFHPRRTTWSSACMPHCLSNECDTRLVHSAMKDMILSCTFDMCINVVTYDAHAGIRASEGARVAFMRLNLHCATQVCCDTHLSYTLMFGYSRSYRCPIPRYRGTLSNSTVSSKLPIELHPRPVLDTPLPSHDKRSRRLLFPSRSRAA